MIRVGDDFYLTASSFNRVPGLPILHSKDLVNWKIIGHALVELSSNSIYLRIEVSGDAVCRFSYGLDGVPLWGAD